MKITIYTTNTCAYCAMVKRYIGQKAPEGTLVDIVNLDDEPSRREEAFYHSAALTVPVTMVETGFPGGIGSDQYHKRVVTGWKPAQLAEALQSAEAMVH